MPTRAFSDTAYRRKLGSATQTMLYLFSGDFFGLNLVSTHPSDSSFPTIQPPADWSTQFPVESYYVPAFPHPSTKSLVLAVFLFLLTLCTCLVAGTQFAVAYAHHQSASVDAFVSAFTLFYKNPAGLLAGLPFAAALLVILLAHELGHFFACRRHHIHSTYPFFIPFPSLIGTFGAFILIRSPIRTTRALFDVGASGPLVGFVFAVPALVYGVMHSAVVPALAHPNASQTDVIFGAPLLLRLLDFLFHPGANPNMLLLPPIGRAAWVGLFATSLNLLPTAQLDGGHILRSLSPRAHKISSSLLPLLLVALGYFRHWPGWYVWAALLFIIGFLRTAPIHDSSPLDPPRQFGAFLTLGVFLLSFMPAPILGL
ncbi:MAG TPA: site-2 protease family protein [Candidatus Methylomirabilis sp.]|nr:site-2 protease family protein [Candidatus Methylomirabilis sp.]